MPLHTSRTLTRRELLGNSAACAGTLFTAPLQSPFVRYRFNRTITEQVLNNYLSRAVSHFGLLASSPEPSTPCFQDDLRMLTSMGAKFVSRSCYAWVPPDDDDAHFRQAKERATATHAADYDMLLEACVFEAVYESVGRIAVPDWVFSAFRVPPATRTFRYEDMLYPGGKFRDHWTKGASVPDMSRVETRMYFYYRSRRYIDAGVEAIHYGQVHLMDHNDPGHAHWASLLAIVRAYAASAARRRMVLCTAHSHGVSRDGVLLFDYHGWPCRPREIISRPQEAALEDRFGDSIYGRSDGGKTPSGWVCSSLPYLVEVDNFGNTSEPGKPGKLPWVWGYDEITWFARQSEAYRNAWAITSWKWVRDRREGGWLALPCRRVLSETVNGSNIYLANKKSTVCPAGFSQEDAYRALWADEEKSRR